MLKTRPFSFIRAHGAAELATGGQRALFYLWNVLVLLLSSLAISVFCLRLGIGLSDTQIFKDYFRFPLLLLLNTLPVLALQLLLLCLFNRQWAAFLGTAIVFVGAALGDFYKLKFRGEPFLFSDMSSIGAAMNVAGSYDLRPNKRIVLILACVLVGLVLMIVLVRGRLRPVTRFVCAALVLLSVYPLGRFVYGSQAIYTSPAASTDHMIYGWAQMEQMSKGFVYQFLYSMAGNGAVRPADYDEARAAGLLAAYEDTDIPEERKVNLLVFQLEAYADLRSAGIEGIDPTVYAPFDRLLAESLHGNMIANVFAGGTINTERSFLAGTTRLLDYSGPAPSYVRYLTGQGYTAVGSHPNARYTYNRFNINSYLGFDEYWYGDDHYTEQLAALPAPWISDAVLFPEVARQFLETAHSGTPVFSFNVTMQGHSPYGSSAYDGFDAILWDGEASDVTYSQLNRYLGSVKETGALLWDLVERLRDDEAPVVLLAFGDHKPGLGDGGSSFLELGVDMNTSRFEGLRNYYGTTWIIWANNAARELLGSDFEGEGPSLSPGLLMTYLFDQLGWTGNAYMQFQRDVLARLPVCNITGSFLADGRLTADLSESDRLLYREWEWLQYYTLRHFSASGK